MDQIFSALTAADVKRIAVVLLLIFFNFAFAVVGALVKGGFDPSKEGLDFKKLPEFVYKQVLPYVIGLAFFEAFLHVLPPSQMAQTLFASAVPSTAAAVEPPTNGWMWLDPTILWTVYGSMVAMLVKQVSLNVIYLFGKGLVAAQSVAAIKK